MRQAPTEPESWKRMVLGSLPPPAWLSSDAPHSDVVLSSRARLMRNLRGFRFPGFLPPPELLEVMSLVLRAAVEATPHLEPVKSLTQAERDHYVGCRLISPEFAWREPGRALLIDEARALVAMINEEDHLRIQALSAGWSIGSAEALARSCEGALAQRLEFAWTPEFGFLAASPYNAGQGRRLSCMLHLIGLAHTKRLPSVVRALGARGLSARGLFGETSRAVGAFVQVSLTGGDAAEFTGAVDYLIQEERAARGGTRAFERKAREAADFAEGSRSLSLADSLRVLAWARWASVAELPRFPASPRAVDAFLARMDVRPDDREQSVPRQRADALRRFLG
ncbi:MAG: hypothetical protein HYR64_02925 [Fimbriimonas ginsengisoli]|uniref:Phosphagen kinase C-terminal domain-containing protein n=1 Tax=Fimbriimonas ginsengisoli TaxID=1005039 RepID=A0A931LZF6_FIMGI|nr:hypothetical protein [Fimbriimonas ginsengisoli]